MASSHWYPHISRDKNTMSWEERKRLKGHGQGRKAKVQGERSKEGEKSKGTGARIQGHIGKSIRAKVQEK